MHKDETNDSKQQIAFQELKYNIRQLEHVLMTLNNITKLLDDKVAIQVQNLQDEVSAIKNESFILHTLPDKIILSLKAIIPEVSKEITNCMLGNLTDTIESCHTTLQQLESKVNAIVTKVSCVRASSLKQILLFTVLVVSSASVIAASSTYFMLKKFPKPIEIRSEGEVSIKNSNVSVWGRKNCFK